jgi:hypothetical protein
MVMGGMSGDGDEDLYEFNEGGFRPAQVHQPSLPGCFSAS